MSDFLLEITNQLNLRWAWDKVRYSAQPGDVWVDEIEVADFELELERNLQKIADDIIKEKYMLTPIKPLPYPKRPGKDGRIRVRQAFQVSIRDQVAWTALVNVVGPHLDKQMPAWSYGNRLYRSIWIDEDENGIKHRKIGRYRHSSGQIYLPFRLSWPIFRRHVYLTTRAMTCTNRTKRPEIDEQSDAELELQKRMDEEYRCPFVLPDYWKTRRPNQIKDELFWCSIDFKKFYPSLKLDVIRENIISFLPKAWRLDARTLLKKMLRFKLDLHEWTNEELKEIDLRKNRRTFSCIPTGLYVAGFLANVSLIKIDLEVKKRLRNQNIAHFRFVDDHVIIAYSFDDLIHWIDEYLGLILAARNGARVNPEKIEPEELSKLIVNKHRNLSPKKLNILRDCAQKKCCLDPQFPTPLMTKTIALVSGIARTNFNILDSEEVENLTDQLEHLLLVALPEEEMPEKTRLSFAASRLSKLTETRLAINPKLASLRCQLDGVKKELTDDELIKEKKQKLEANLTEIENTMKKEYIKTQRELERVFQLIRKALREHPEQIRLWTRALLMCRLTGVRRLKDLRSDIKQLANENSLVAEYLYANTLSLLGGQALIAARVLNDDNVAGWRKKAALNFLEDLSSTFFPKPKNIKTRTMIKTSQNIYHFGLYCVTQVMKYMHNKDYLLSFADKFIKKGERLVTGITWEKNSTGLIWWASRKTLRDLNPKADLFVYQISKLIQPSDKIKSFWKFFPFDVRPDILKVLSTEPKCFSEGWWYDAIGTVIKNDTSLIFKSKLNRIKQSILLQRKDTVSLYDWCQFISDRSKDLDQDPRKGEWTALEIVRQIAELISVDVTSGSYFLKPDVPSDRVKYLHPANFRIPCKWVEDKIPTWEKWRTIVWSGKKRKKIQWVSKKYRIVDPRYTPLKTENPLYMEVNQVRGLGLLLYGLLNGSFTMPSLWNGPGYTIVLRMLPVLLLKRMTCSSYTLGILQGCLQPRVTENLYFNNMIHQVGAPNNDTLHDPIGFISAMEVMKGLKISQRVLEKNQISTIQHNARQLIPVSIRQITHTEWDKEIALFQEE